MAFKKFVRYAYAVPDRCEKRNMTATAATIKETLEDFQWWGFDSHISMAIFMALADNQEMTFEDSLPQVASKCKFTVFELQAYPNIREYFGYEKRNAIRRAQLEREVKEKYEGRKNDD